jgi:hypothetical protein
MRAPSFPRSSPAACRRGAVALLLAIVAAAPACSHAGHDDESLEAIAARTSVLMPVSADRSCGGIADESCAAVTLADSVAVER